MTLAFLIVLTACVGALFYALGYSQGKRDGVEAWAKLVPECIDKIVALVNELLPKPEETEK